MGTFENHPTANSNAPKAARFACVMSVDDDVVDQMMYRRALQRADIAKCHLQFTEPLKALAQLADASSIAVDLILLDLNMPLMNGFEFLSAAERSLGPATMPPVVLISGAALSPINQQHAARYATIIAQLEKPLELNALLNALKDAHLQPLN